MAAQDRLEIISPTGDIKFYDLDPARGVTNIGRHPDNDVIIDSPSVAPFHAVLYHQEKPYQVILLGAGQGSTRTLNGWDTLNLDGYALVLLEAETAAGQIPAGLIPAAAIAGLASGAPPTALPLPRKAEMAASHRAEDETSLPLPPPASSLAASNLVPGALIANLKDEVVVAEFSAREFTLDPEQTANCTVTMINGGDIVATFLVTVQGLDDRWVSVTPSELNLNEGEHGTATITLSVPRLPSSRAGPHHFGIVVSSPDYPGRASQAGATLIVNPYFEYSVSDLSPKQQNIPYGKRAGRAAFSLTNSGNSELKFQVQATDDARACQFEFQARKNEAPQARQIEISLQPEETQAVQFTIAPLKRVFFGITGVPHAFSVQATPLGTTLSPRSLLGQAQSLPLIGPLHVAVVIILLAVLAIFMFRPRITNFAATPPQVLSSEIMTGKKVTLSWDVSWLSTATLDQGVGPLPGGTTGTTTVAPVKSTTYRLSASNLISMLIPAFGATREQTVIVDPVEPIVRLAVDRDKVLEGETVTLSWEVLNASEVVLKINGTPETLPPEQYIGKREMTAKGETTYTLEARNLYTTGAGIVQTRVVNASKPTPTPLPLPVIQLFTVPPGPVIAGDTVTLEWSVVGVDKVTVEPLGEFPPIGKTIDKPAKTTSYQLIASNGQQEVRSLRELIVNPPPTATPVPGMPKIDVLKATPNQVALGSAELSNIQLTWAVSGDFTDIQLSGDTVGRVSGLPTSGIRTVTAGTKDTEFVLTVLNGPLSASQSVTVKVVVPVPAISSLSPASAVAGDASNLTLTVNGANFVSGATVRWDGADQPTVFVNSSQLTAIVAASAYALRGKFPITVFNPAESGGGASNAVNFIVNNPTPVLNELSFYTTLVGGGQDLTLGLTGSGFVPDSKVMWSGVALQTTYTDQNSLTAVIPGANTDNAGSYVISVINPGGGSSSGKTFTVENPVPSISSLNPNFTAVQPAGPFTDLLVIIQGTGFLKSSVVSWDGAIINGTRVKYVSATELHVNVPGNYFQNIGSVSVSVINSAPGGGPSAPATPAFQVSKIPTTLTFTPSPASAVTGQTVILQAAITFPGGLNYAPTGKIVFWNGTTQLNSVTVASDGTASLTWSFAAGSPSLKVTYAGDNNFAGSTTTAVLYSVQPASTDTTVFQSSTSVFGQSVQFSASVNAHTPGSNSPVAPCGGNVQFLLNGNKWGDPVALTGANCGGSVLSPLSGTGINFNLLTITGPNNITAKYYSTGDANFSDSTVSDPPMAHPVVALTPNMTLVDQAPSGSDYGVPIVLTATVSSGTGAPISGNVAFSATPQGSSAVSLGSVVLGAGGTATLAPTNIFTAGLTTFQANFTSTDANFTNASALDPHTVNRILPNSVTFYCFRLPAPSNSVILFTGSLTKPASPPGLAMPTGTMNFTIQNLVDLSQTVVPLPVDVNGNAGSGGLSVAANAKITVQYVPNSASNYSGMTGTDIGGMDSDPTSCITYYP